MNTYKDTEDLVESFFINKIYDILLNDSVEKGIDSESQAKYLQFVFDVITTYTKDQKRMKKKSIGIRLEEISKKVSRWSYKLAENLGEEEEENEEESEEEYYEIQSRRAKRVIISNDNDQNTNSISSIYDFSSIQNTNNNDQNDNQTEEGEVTLIRYSQQSDFRRNLIKGSSKR